MTNSSLPIWHLLHNVKSMVKISSIFVAFIGNRNLLNYIGMEWPKIVPWLGALVWYQERLPRYLNIGKSMSLYYNKPHKRKWKYIYRTNKQWPQSLFNCNNSSTKLHVLTLARFICAELFLATNVVVFGPFFD